MDLPRSELRFVLTGALALGAALFAGCQSEQEALVDGAPANLIGGQLGTPFPATVYLTDGCTAAKVAPRMLLTAAHCVLDTATLQPKYASARPIALSPDPASGSRAYVVANIHVHPVFLERCARTLCSISAIVAKLDAPDVAVVELAEPLEGVPVARIDDHPLAPGDPVVIEGFGCTRGVYVPDDRKVATLTASKATVASPETAIHEGSYVRASDLPIFSGNYTITAGPGAAGANAGLCPGDSGGPLYAPRELTPRDSVARTSELVIVGVNANYTFVGEAIDANGLPMTNWHTRLDRESRNGVAVWLRSVLGSMYYP